MGELYTYRNNNDVSDRKKVDVLKVWAKQADIAKEAGVSLATVDRVLNNRPGVSIRTANKIWKAIEQLQQDSTTLPATQHHPLQLDVILPAGPNTFLNILAEKMEILQKNLALRILH